MPDSSHPLRRWRDRHGRSIYDAAAAADTTAATISRIETGRQYPKPGLLARLVSLTGVSADQFLASLPRAAAKARGAR